MNWYIKCLKNYAVFSGRARRTEYWMFILFNFIFASIAIFLDRMLGTEYTQGGYGLGSSYGLGYGVIYTLYVLAVAIPSLAVLVRRLHDIGKSGLWVFISLIPIIGAIWIIILAVTDGVSGSNKYGSDPKLAEE